MPNHGSDQSVNGAASKANLRYPAGYVQNPYASDMSADRRFATEQSNRSMVSLRSLDIPVASRAVILLLLSMRGLVSSKGVRKER